MGEQGSRAALVSAVFPRLGLCWPLQPSQGLHVGGALEVSPHKPDDCLVVQFLSRGWETKPKLATYPVPLLPLPAVSQPCLVFNVLAQGRQKFLVITAFCLLPGALLCLFFNQIASVWLSVLSMYLLCFTNMRIYICMYMYKKLIYEKSRHVN